MLLALIGVSAAIGCDSSIFGEIDAEVDARTAGDARVDLAAIDPDMATADAGPPLDPCGLPPVDSDAPRTVLVGHRFTDELGVRGTEVRSLVLRDDGALVDVGDRLDLGDAPAKIAVAPSGRIALVAGDEGSISVVDLQDPANLAILDVAAVPRAGIADLLFDASGQTAYLLRSDVDEDTAGVYTLHLACDGTLTVDDAHFGLRLTRAMAVLPNDPDRAILLGGQAVFDPIDDDDVRLLERTDDGWQQVGAFDVYGDVVSAAGIAVSAAGVALVPNSLPFSDEGGQVAVLEIDGDQVTEVARLENLPEADLVRIAPDGQTGLLLRPAADRLTILDGGAGWRVADEINLGLAIDMAIVRSGAASGIALVPSVLPAGGSRVTVLRVIAPGRVEEVDRVELGPGAEQIPGPVGVRP